MSEQSGVWVFKGEGANFPSGVFSTLEFSEAWIAANKLTGILTLYPVDIGTYDWVVANGYFQPKTDKEKSAKFIGGFSSAYQKHYHYRNGRIDDGSDEDDRPALSGEAGAS